MGPPADSGMSFRFRLHIGGESVQDCYMGWIKKIKEWSEAITALDSARGVVWSAITNAWTWVIMGLSALGLTLSQAILAGLLIPTALIIATAGSLYIWRFFHPLPVQGISADDVMRMIQEHLPESENFGEFQESLETLNNRLDELSSKLTAVEHSQAKLRHLEKVADLTVSKWKSEVANALIRQLEDAQRRMEEWTGGDLPHLDAMGGLIRGYQEQFRALDVAAEELHQEFSKIEARVIGEAINTQVAPGELFKNYEQKQQYYIQKYFISHLLNVARANLPNAEPAALLQGLRD